jgi:hypothetical protein
VNAFFIQASVLPFGMKIPRSPALASFIQSTICVSSLRDFVSNAWLSTSPTGGSWALCPAESTNARVGVPADVRHQAGR